MGVRADLRFAADVGAAAVSSAVDLARRDLPHRNPLPGRSRREGSVVKSHEVDSSELSFKIAASMGFKEAVEKAQPILMEPIMKVEVVTPSEFLGDVSGDITRPSR